MVWWKSIHEYNNLNDLLNDVEIKFLKSRENEVSKGLEIHIYKYNKQNYNISCDEFYSYIFTAFVKIVVNLKIYATICN